jgi:hypothetical protein
MCVWSLIECCLFVLWMCKAVILSNVISFKIAVELEVFVVGNQSMKNNKKTDGSALVKM